jgi:hypothetical protein
VPLAQRVCDAGAQTCGDGGVPLLHDRGEPTYSGG